MTLIGPIERRSLHEELADKLRRAIIHGEFEPGVKISEKALCEQFGVSRTPVREALKILSAEGLVQLTQNRGAAVTQLTRRDMQDAFPVMGALEALAGELAAKNATDAQIERMKVLQSRLVAMFKKGDRKGYFRVNEEIHQLMFQASDNAVLARMVRSVSAQVRRARYQANLSADRWAAAVKEHEEILEAFVDRDAQRLSELLKTHLANKLKALEATMLQDVE
jgi:DNA-binding GntR family transcriptional regulator